MAIYNVPEDVNSFPEVWSILHNMQKEAHPNDPRSKIIKGISMLLSKDRGVLLKEGTRQSDTAPGLLNCLYHPKLASALDIAFQSPVWTGFGVKGVNMGFWCRVGLKNIMGVCSTQFLVIFLAKSCFRCGLPCLSGTMCSLLP
jgi:hypothetical protein